MQKHILSLSALTLLLAGCSYALDKSTQEIEIVTPGAQDALCYMYVDDIRYRVYPPQKIIIPKSREDLVIDCMAPGNRRNKVFIEADYADNAGLNVLNGGVGALWDATSGALYQYPPRVEVSFVYTPEKPWPLPAQNNPDIRQPEDYPLEEFRPGKPRMNDDGKSSTVEIRMRNRGGSQPSQSAPAEAFMEGPPAPSSGKGNLQNAAPSSSAGSENSPTTLYPGQ